MGRGAGAHGSPVGRQLRQEGGPGGAGAPSSGAVLRPCQSPYSDIESISLAEAGGTVTP